jgi:hypothetical protein
MKSPAQAASRLSFAKPRILSITFDGAAIGKPSRDILLLAQFSPTTNASVILPPQEMKASASKDESMMPEPVRPRLLVADPAEELIVVRPGNPKQTRKANLEHLAAVDSALSHMNGYGLSAFLPVRQVGALPPAALRYWVDQPCALTNGVRRRASQLLLASFLRL